MSFGVNKKELVEGKRVVKAITVETIVALVIIVAVFSVFALRMGLANMFGTMMATVHDLMLNTVFFCCWDDGVSKLVRPCQKPLCEAMRPLVN